MDYEQEQKEMKQDRAKLAGLAKKVVSYPLMFEGITRIAEANLPPEYSEITRNIRTVGETIYGIGLSITAIGLATPWFGWATAYEIYKGLRGK